MGKKNEIKSGELPPWVPSWERVVRTPIWLKGIELANSTDGVHFEKVEDGLTVNAGSVPCMLADYGNECIVAMYQSFSLETVEEYCAIVVIFSHDEGETWTKPQVVTFHGLPEPLPTLIPSIGKPCDPALVLLDDGRYRLYFTYPEPQAHHYYPDHGGIDYPFARILSATSDDYINFEVEEGIRFMDEGIRVTDATVIEIGDKWHYYSSIFDGEGNSYHAVSEDGLNFTRVDDIMGMRMFGGALPVEGGYRFYGVRHTAFSTDGYNWMQEGVELPGPDPGVVRLKDGTYLLLYRTGIHQ